MPPCHTARPSAGASDRLISACSSSRGISWAVNRTLASSRIEAFRPAILSRMATIEQDYAEQRPKSKALHERAIKRMPSGVAHDGRSFSPFPFYVARADGARKWDVDGHEYIDCWSGHGSLMLGHNHPAVLKAITEQAAKGLHYSACSELELRWAELVRSIVPGAERVRFTLTGTETTSLAVRVARAFTGRDHIIKFEIHFHGVHD